MLKLVVVDDEKIIRDGIKNCLQWSDYGIELMGDFRNGAEALEVLIQTKPDIVLTDVKMPIMDGIALAGKLRELYSDVKIIFISGYADLEYLRSAFKVDVADYILKPVDIDELTLSIKKVTDQCNRENEMNAYQLKLEQRLLQSMPFLREKFMKLLVSGEIKDQVEILERLKFLDIDIPYDGLYSVFIISIDNYKEAYTTEGQLERQLFSFSVLNIAQEVILEYCKGYAFEWSEDMFACVINLPMDETQIEECIDSISTRIHNCLNQFLQVSNTIGIGLWVNGIENLNRSYRHALNATGQKIVMGKNRVIYVDRFYDGREESYVPDGDFFEKLYSALRGGDHRNAVALVENMYSGIRKFEMINIKYIRSLHLQIVSIIAGVAAQFSANDECKVGNIVYLSEELLKKETLDEMHQFLISAIHSVCSLLLDRQDKESGNVIQYIRNLIQTRYGECLSIQLIAREVYLTPAYICLLFKQETGQTINEFLTSVRIEKAKELIRQGRHKILEIASLVGYSDHKYFSKLFKKHTGVNPSEYR